MLSEWTPRRNQFFTLCAAFSVFVVHRERQNVDGHIGFDQEMAARRVPYLGKPLTGGGGAAPQTIQFLPIARN